MDWHSIITALADLRSVVQLLAIAGPVCAGIAGYLYIRCRYQRQYLRAVHRLDNLQPYLKKRRAAFRELDVPAQMLHEATEGKLASDLKLDIRPHSVGTASYFNASDRGFLKQATRQLADNVFVGFADDLLQRLVLLLDTRADLANQRRNTRYAEDQDKAYRRIDELRKRVQDDTRQLDCHVRMMQRYLAGKLDVDICSDKTSTMLRTMLDEKYSAYNAMTLQDEEVLTGGQSN